MNLIDYILIAVLAAVVGLAIYSTRKRRKKGGGCCGSCSSCSSCAGCGSCSMKNQ